MGEAKKRGTMEDRKSQALAAKGLPLYRFFKTRERAEALLNGEVWVSTLQKCREYDDPQQGDKYEGSANYLTSINTGDRPVSKEEQERALHGGVGIADGVSNITIGSINTEFIIPNGFLLCTTNDPISIKQQSDEWAFGVQINLSQRDIFDLLSEALLRKGVPLTNGSFGWADYDTQRIYYDHTTPPKNLAFIKPKVHKAQSEYRFFWEAQEGYKYGDGILLNCPEIKPYLKAIIPPHSHSS